MSASDLLLLALAGFGAGVVGSTAGLASLVSYPALLAIGLPPVIANVTNTLGLVGSSIGSVSGSRPELTGLSRALLLRRLVLAVVGGAVGAALLLLGSPGAFESVVPFLVALASILLLLSPRIRRWSLTSAHSRRPWLPLPLLLTFGYGGYFGAAAGVMILALLLSGTEHPLPVANALKNLLLGAANAAGAILFAVAGQPEWVAVPPLLIGCIAGGRLGPAVVRRVPEPVMRWSVGVAGLLLALRLGWVAFG